MFTIALAWINAKYNKDYCFTFILTFVIDIEVIDKLLNLI